MTIIARAMPVADGDVMLECRLYVDDALVGPLPAVLIYPDLWGIGAQSSDWAHRLAALGYATLAVDMFGDGAQPHDLAEGLALMNGITVDRGKWRERASRPLAALAALDDVDAARIGAIGFCFGGSTVLELARSGVALAAAACLHGEIIPLLPGEAEAVQAKLLVCTGSADPLVPMEQCLRFMADLTGSTVDWQILLLGGAGHSFSNPDAARAGVPGIAYDAVAALRAWNAAKALFAETLDGAG